MSIKIKFSILLKILFIVIKQNQQAWKVHIKNPHQAEEEKQYSSTELLDMLRQSFAKGDKPLEKLRKELQP